MKPIVVTLCDDRVVFAAFTYTFLMWSDCLGPIPATVLGSRVSRPDTYNQSYHFIGRHRCREEKHAWLHESHIPG